MSDQTHLEFAKHGGEIGTKDTQNNNNMLQKVNFHNTVEEDTSLGKEGTDCTSKQGFSQKFRNETQGPHVFSFTLLVKLGTMNLLALLP